MLTVHVFTLGTSLLCRVTVYIIIIIIIIILFLLLFLLLFRYSASLLHIQIPVHKLNFFLIQNYNGLPATPACVLGVSVLIGYDCLTVMFQCKLEKFFLRGMDRTESVLQLVVCVS